MIALQLGLTGVPDDAVATARLSVGDPAGQVVGVEFDVIAINADATEVRTGPFPADRAPAIGFYEKDIPLDAARPTRVEARAQLGDGTVADAPVGVTFAARRGDAALARALGVLNAVVEYGLLSVAVTPGSAAAWKCWARRNGWPTNDGTPAGPVDDVYLRFEGYRDAQSFSMQADGAPGDVWCVVAIGFNAAGEAGPRRVDTMIHSWDRSVRAAMNVAALPTDGVRQRQIEAADGLREFTSWLEQFKLRGYIAEVGWSWIGADGWNQVAESWYALADKANLWVTAWATGETWGPGYTLQPYAVENGAWVKKPQSAVIERLTHRSNAQYQRGVNVAGAEFGAPNVQARVTWFSNVNRGASGPGGQYTWNGLATYQYLAAQGHTLARVPFRWERIQPTLGGALDPDELLRMTNSVAAAGQAGLSVILDVHNYGAYWLHDASTSEGVRYSIGTPQVTFADFADLWTRLATAFRDNASVIGYGFMNEPVSMTPAVLSSPSVTLTPARTWETAAQRAVDAIRAVEGAGAHKWIMVGGYMWSGTWSIPSQHKVPFIRDSAVDRLMYEAHQYWDDDRSGQYATPELDPVPQEHWVRWTPNAAMWSYQSAGGNGTEAYQIEVFRVGELMPASVIPLWKKGFADPQIFCPGPADPACVHRNAEYRVVATNVRDGSVLEYAAAVSGSYK